MQTSCGINNNHIGTIGFGRRDCIKGHRSRVRAHLLFNNRHTYTLAPNANLLNGSSTEGVGSSKIHFLTSLFKLIGQFSYRGGFTHTIYTHYHDNIGGMVGWEIPVVIVLGIIF